MSALCQASMPQEGIPGAKENRRVFSGAENSNKGSKAVEKKNIPAIIPAHNAEVSIAKVIEETRAHVRRIIVVNDGSTDCTAEAAGRREVELINLNRQNGKGYALRMGFAAALTDGCPAVITLDADGQHDPHDIPNFLAAHDRDPEAILVGSRWAEAERFPRQRYFSNAGAAFFISKALRQDVEDSQCGFRLYPAPVLRRIPLKTKHFQMETEVLLQAAKQGVRLRSVPVKNIYLNGNGPQSNFRPVVDTFYICLVVLQSYLGLL